MDYIFVRSRVSKIDCTNTTLRHKVGSAWYFSHDTGITLEPLPSLSLDIKVFDFIFPQLELLHEVWEIVE
jgi:hypothetical protein